MCATQCAHYFVVVQRSSAMAANEEIPELQRLLRKMWAFNGGILRWLEIIIIIIMAIDALEQREKTSSCCANREEGINVKMMLIFYRIFILLASYFVFFRDKFSTIKACVNIFCVAFALSCGQSRNFSREVKSATWIIREIRIIFAYVRNVIS